MISREVLIDKVLIQIQNDLEAGDLTAVQELLSFVPLVNLIGFLPEGEIDASEVEEEETFTRI